MDGVAVARGGEAADGDAVDVGVAAEAVEAGGGLELRQQQRRVALRDDRVEDVLVRPGGAGGRGSGSASGGEEAAEEGGHGRGQSGKKGLEV